jgi:hypothetical protein
MVLNSLAKRIVRPPALDLPWCVAVADMRQ